jgi:formate/nitrite transporter
MNESRPVTMYKTPKQTLLVVMKAGVAKGVSMWWQLLALGFHAGVFIGFGGGLVVAVVGALDSAVEAGYKKLLSGLIFPVCLIIIVISGAELFTGNVMYMLAARMSGQTTWKNLAKNWFFSYFGNLCGALFIGYFLFHLTHIFHTTTYDAYLNAMVVSKVKTYTFGETVLKGVGCNYLVCLSLWCAAASDDILSKIVSIWWPLMAFVAIGFEHSIANMFYIPLAIMNTATEVTAGEFIAKNLVPVTIGNIIGGALFIFVQYLIYHPYITDDVKLMQLKQGRKKNDDDKSSFAPKGSKRHFVPTNQDTLFRDVANALWFHYCSFMQNVVGIVVYDQPACDLPNQKNAVVNDVPVTGEIELKPSTDNSKV